MRILVGVMAAAVGLAVLLGDATLGYARKPKAGVSVGGDPAVAMFPFTGPVPQNSRVLRRLSQELRQLARDGYIVVEGKELRKRLGQDPMKAIVRCGTDPQCAGTLATRADVTFVLTGQAAPAGSGVQVFLSLVAPDGEIVQSAFTSLRSEADVAEELPALAALFGTTASAPIAAADDLMDLPPLDANAPAPSQAAKAPAATQAPAAFADLPPPPDFLDGPQEITALPLLPPDPGPGDFTQMALAPGGYVGPAPTPQSGLRITGFVLAGAGALAAGGGAFIGYGANVQRQSYNRNELTQLEAQTRVNEINGRASLANTLLIGAGGAIVVGLGCLVVDLLTGPSEGSSSLEMQGAEPPMAVFTW